MKKILLSSLLGAFLCVIYISGGLQVIYASCSWSEGGSVGGQFDNCLLGTQLVNSRGNMSLTGGFKTQVTKWTTNVATLLGLLAIGAIVYGGLLMTLSAGEEEKVKKGKDIVKWSLLGFLALILAGALVRIVIEFIFAVSG